MGCLRLTYQDNYDETFSFHRTAGGNYVSKNAKTSTSDTQKNCVKSNHLNNVLSVISDKPVPHSTNGTTHDYYMADILQSTDYSAFGVTLSGRNFVKANAKESRRGFNGMEEDDEVKGDGNSYDFGARMLDPRLGRWLSIDEHFSLYPNQSPYISNDNNPLFFADKDGNDAIGTIEGNTITIKSTLYVYNEGKHKIDIKKMQKSINKCYSGNHTTKVDGKSYNVKFEITVKEISTENLTKPMEAGGNYVQPMPSDYRSNVQGAGGHYGKFAEGQYDDPTYPHEVGHMIGLDDQYIDIMKVDDNTLASDKGEIKSVDIPGTAKNELMGTAARDWKNNPQLTEKDINALAKFVIKNQKDGVTFINSKNVGEGLASPSAGAKFDFLIEMDKKGYEVVEPHTKK